MEVPRDHTHDSGPNRETQLGLEVLDRLVRDYQRGVEAAMAMLPRPISAPDLALMAAGSDAMGTEYKNLVTFIVGLLDENPQYAAAILKLLVSVEAKYSVWNFARTFGCSGCRHTAHGREESS